MLRVEKSLKKKQQQQWQQRKKLGYKEIERKRDRSSQELYYRKQNGISFFIISSTS